MLEEMPPFPERESSILAKLKKKKPEAIEGGDIKPSQASKMPAAQISSLPLPTETESKPPEVSIFLYDLSGQTAVKSIWNLAMPHTLTILLAS